jgi:hypothetical protein
MKQKGQNFLAFYLDQPKGIDVIRSINPMTPINKNRITTRQDPRNLFSFSFALSDSPGYGSV